MSLLRIANLSGSVAGGSWAADDTIVFALRGIELSGCEASGGPIERIAGVRRWPRGPKCCLTPKPFSTRRASQEQETPARSLRSGYDGRDQRIVASMGNSAPEGPRVLGTGGGIAQARFVSSGFLIYGQSPGIVRALRIDPSSLTPTSSPIPLID